MRALLPHLPNPLGENAAPEASIRHLSAPRLPLQSHLEVSNLPLAINIYGINADCKAVPLLGSFTAGCDLLHGKM